MGINTKILADVASSREGAAYLHRLARADHDAATAAHKAKSMSEPGWSGEAATAYRDYVGKNAKDADELVRVIKNVAQALDKFADQIYTCTSRMQMAHDAARDGKLTVTGWVIHPPAGDETDGASKGMGTTSLPGLNPKADANDDAWAAWHQVESMTDWARNLESTAHKELNASLSDANGIVASLQKPSFWIGQAASFGGGLHGAATTLQAEAAKRLEWVQKFERLAADSNMPAATRQAHIATMMRSIGLTEAQAKSNARALGNLGNTKVGNLAFNPLTKTLGGSRKGFWGALGRTGSVVGTLLTAANAGKQIVFGGKPVYKTIETNFTGFALGALVGRGAALVAGAAGAASAPVTILGVGVGSAATWVYNYSQTHSWDDFQHDVGELVDGAEGVARKAIEPAQERWGPGAAPPMGR